MDFYGSVARRASRPAGVGPLPLEPVLDLFDQPGTVANEGLLFVGEVDVDNAADARRVEDAWEGEAHVVLDARVTLKR